MAYTGGAWKSFHRPWPGELCESSVYVRLTLALCGLYFVVTGVQVITPVRTMPAQIMAARM